MMKFLATLFTLSAWFRTRKYKSGTGWCFWRWTDTDSEYILRLHVLKTPWFAVCLHWINKPDAEPWLHDHPVSFLSIILRGGYAELRQGLDDKQPRHRVRRWFNFMWADHRDMHRIMLVRKNTLTLALMGPKTREWGFHVWTDIAPAGWIHWKRYYERLRAGEDMRRTCFFGDIEKLVTSAYTDEQMKKSAGIPDGTPEDADKRPIDGAPADDFVAEPPTEPYGANNFGKGPYGG